MKVHHLFFVVLMTVTSSLWSQRNYKIKFDKLSRNYSYYEIKGNGREKKITYINPEPLDHFDIEIINANPLLFRTEISFLVENKVIDSGNKSTGALSLMQEFFSNSPLNGLSSFLSTIGDRGETGQDQETTALENVKSAIQDYRSSYKSYSDIYSELKSLMLSSTEPCDSIQIKCKIKLNQIKGKIENCEDKRTKVFESLEQVSNVMRSEILSSEASLENPILTSQDIIQIEQQLSLISKPYTKSFIMDEVTVYDDEELKEASSISSIEMSHLKINISFFEIQETKSNSNTSQTANPDFVRYYYKDSWVDSNGKIQDEMCSECRPVVRAEGYVHGAELEIKPFEESQIWDDDFNAYGQWTFYNKKGAVQNIIELTDSYQVVPKDEFALILKAKDDNTPRFSTGLFFISPFNGRNEFQKLSSLSGDSIMVVNNNQKQFLPTIGSVLSFRVLQGRNNAVTFNMGASIDITKGFNLSDGNSLNFITGLGFKNKNWDFLALSAGLSYSQVAVLDNTITENKWYSSGTNEFSKLLFGEEIKTVYRPGLYIGIHLNL